MDNLAQSAIQKVRNLFKKKELVSAQPWNTAGQKPSFTQDQEGWIRGGQFTPGKQISEFVNRQTEEAWKPTGVAYKAVTGAQSGLNKISNLPRIEFNKPQVSSPVLQTGINLAYGIPESIANIPRNYITGIARTGQELGTAYREGRGVNLQNLAGGVAPLAESLIDIGTFGGGTVAKNIAKTGAKQTIKEALIKGAAKGAGVGGLGGLTYGLDTQYGKEFNPQQLVQNVAGGALLGGVLGGGISGVPAVVNTVKNAYKNLGISDEVANTLTKQHFISTENKPITFRQPKAQKEFWAKINKQLGRPSDTPVYQDDLKGLINQTTNIPQTQLSAGLSVKPKGGIEAIKQADLLAEARKYKSAEEFANAKLNESQPLLRDRADINRAIEAVVKNSNINQKAENKAFQDTAKKLAKEGRIKLVTLGDGSVFPTDDAGAKLVYENIPDIYKPETTFDSVDLNKLQSEYSKNLSIYNQAKAKTNQQMGIAPQKVQVRKTEAPIKQRNKAIQEELNSQIQAKVGKGISKSDLSTPSNVSISQKGKLNVKNLNISDEQKSAINQLQDSVPVTVIGNKDVIQTAKLTKGSKKALTDKEMQNRLAQQLNSRQEVVNLSKQFEKLKQSGASEDELLSLKSKIIDQSRVAQQEGTFAGRQLQARNILANELATPEQKIYALLDNAGIDQKAYLKDAVNVDFNNPTQVVQFYRKYVPPTRGELLDEIRYTNMLSSPLTHIVNVSSNLLQSGVVKPIEKTITGSLDFISSKLTGKERKYFASQGLDYAKGYWGALPEAWSKFKNTVKGDEVSLRPDMENIPLATKGALKTYTTPLRVLEGADQLFRTMVTAGEKKSLAKLKLSPTELSKRAEQSADYTLFRQKFDPDGKLGQGVVLQAWDKVNSAIQHIRRVPGGNWLLPFIQTPTNILKQGVEYSPLGFATMIGNKAPIEQLSKALIGSGVFLTAYGLANKGGMTWDTPTNPKDRELFYAAGLQPYSIKVGNKWVSFSKLGPLAYPLAMASAAKWVEKNNPDQNVIDNLIGGIGEMTGFFGDQSYVQTIGDLIDTLKSGGKLKEAIGSEASNLVSQLVPYRAFQGWLTRIVDPIYRKPEGIVQTITSQVPGLSTTVPAYADIYGNESKRSLPGLNAISPLRVSEEKPEAAKLYESQEQYRVQQGIENRAEKEVEKKGGTKVSGKVAYYTDTDGSVKKIDYGKVINMPTTTLTEKVKKQKESFKIIDDIQNSSLSDDEKSTIYSQMGITPQIAKYYTVAGEDDDVKTAYVVDRISQLKTKDRKAMLTLLIKGRLDVNNKQIVSSGVITQLYDMGLISKSEASYLKKLKLGQNQGKLQVKTTGRGKSAKLKKVKFVPMKVSPAKVNKIKLK